MATALAGTGREATADDDRARGFGAEVVDVDVLSHVFLPLTVAYALWPERFTSPAVLALGGLGLLSDFDKFLGVPGLLHSALTIVPLCLVVLAAEKFARDRFVWSPLLAGLIASHLVLDVVDGGPVPLLYPLTDAGIGLTYPVRVAFGVPPVGIALEGPLVALRTTAPRGGFNTYGFVDGAGVAIALAFAVVYVVGEYADRQ
jgi:hypothetical protein